MKITAVRLTPVNIPLDVPFLVPEGPGLGVELDREALARWHRHYEEHGPMNHFLNLVRPDRYRRLPLA